MKAEKPAEGILKLNDWGESVWYHIPCDCLDSDHAHTVEVEADDHSVSVHIYTTVKTKFWSKGRWRQIWDILTKGYSEYEASIILKEQQALNYAETVKIAIEDVKQFKAKHQAKRKAEK